MNRTKLTTILFALLSLVAVTFVCCKNDEETEAQTVTQNGVNPGSPADDPVKNGKNVTAMTDPEIGALDDKTEKCWHAATQITVNKQTATEDFYIWATEHDLVYVLKTAYDEAAAKYKNFGLVAEVKIFYLQTKAADRNACLDLNATNPGKIEGDEACYLITISAGNVSETFYTWSTEDLIKQIISNYDLPNVTITWEKVSASDMKSCKAKNN